jgi:putative peptide zinc metalloprotease protein
VHTQDGSTVYDVAVALVWAEDGVADNVNSAYALASCKDCSTVAVAFQVVLVLGQSDVVPQNLAAAVNYSCITCVTGALAQQLVVTLDGPLDEATERELAELWTRIAAYGDTLEGRSLTEIRAQLTEFEREILTVLDSRASGSSTSTARATPTASPTSTATPTTTPTTSADPTADPSGGPTPTPSGSPDASSSTTSASPTGSPSTTGEDEDGPSPTPAPSPSGSTSPSVSPTAEPSSHPDHAGPVGEHRARKRLAAPAPERPPRGDRDLRRRHALSPVHRTSTHALSPPPGRP